MKNRFPHLNDATAFPGNNGQPYGQYPNDFSYERWGVGTKITVCRVPWDLDRNVVDWQTNDTIVEYFHGLDSSSSFKLESEMNREPDGSIRLPIPISNLKKYNYLFVEYSTPTSTEQPLDYAAGNRQPFIGFFMRDFRFIAPSTTEAQLDTDWWTTSITSLQVQNLMLERGHAPMAAISVDQYLADPIHNNRYLLTADVSFAEPSITTASQFESWMATTEPLMVLAVSSSLQQVQAMLAKKDLSGKSTAPSFSKEAARWGRDYKVSGYSWAGVSPYKTSQVQSTTWSTSTGLPSGVSMVAVKVKQAKAFLDYVQSNSPEFFSVIQTCFLIPGSLVASTEAGTFGGVQLYELKPLEQLPPVPVTLEKEDFGYPSEYAKIAKLYTYPYAGLTFSDNQGHTVDVRIEYTSSVQIHRRVSLAYPYLRAQAFLSGVNGTGDTSYEWVDAAGIQKTGSMPQAEWTDTLLEYEIPTYALTQTSYSQYLLQNSNAAEQERLRQLQAYHNSARSLNQGTENTKDAADTAHDNGIRSNDTSLANGNRSNDTSLSNTQASNATSYANTLASNATSYNNALASNATAYNNSLASNATAQGNANRSADAQVTATSNSNATNAEMVELTNSYSDSTNGLAKNFADANFENRMVKMRHEIGNEMLGFDIRDIFPNWDFEEFPNINSLESSIYKAVSEVNEEEATRLVNMLFVDYSALSELNSQSGGTATNMMIVNSILQQTQAAITGGFSQFKNYAGAALQAVTAVASAAGGLPGIAGAASAAAASGTSGSGELSTQGGLAAAAGESGFSAQRAVINPTVSAVNTAAPIALSTAGDRVAFHNSAVLNEEILTASANANLRSVKVAQDSDGSLVELTKDNMDASLKLSKQLNTDKNKKQRDLATKQTALSAATAKANAADSKSTADSNASASKTTADANASASKTTADANALASKNTSDSNAQTSHDTTAANLTASWDATRLNIDATQKVTKENSVFTQDASLLNAQQNLSLAQQLWAMGAENHKTDGPITRGAFTGDPLPELWGQRGVEVRVKTQPLGAIASAGSEMLRYGYRLDQAWRWTGWSCMKHFTYWKASDLWLTPSSAFAELGKEKIRGIIGEGVTVWRHPEEIGTVPVTENWED